MNLDEAKSKKEKAEKEIASILEKLCVRIFFVSTGVLLFLIMLFIFLH